MTKLAYVPEDSHLTVESLRFLASPAGENLRRQTLEEQGKWTPSQIERARKQYPKDLVHAALTLGALQAKATGPKGKFVGMDYVWATPEAFEQATSLRLARYKARRMQKFLAESGGADAEAVKTVQIWDFCAGMGGDALGMAQQFSGVPGIKKPFMWAVDLSEVRLWCCAQNARELGIEVDLKMIPGDVTAVVEKAAESAGARFFHIDPARRNAGKRSHAWEDLMPGPEEIEQIASRFTSKGGMGGAVKMSPGVDFGSLPTSGCLGEGAHLEIISEFGTAVQAILWVGQIGKWMGEGRTATVLDGLDEAGAETFSITGIPSHELVAEELVVPGATAGEGGVFTWLYEMNAAVHRAGLAGQLAALLGLRPVNADGGYLAGQARLEHPALKAFAVLASLEYSEKAVSQALRMTEGMGGGAGVEVKTRGGLNLDTDKLQRGWNELLRKQQMKTGGGNGGGQVVTILIYRGKDGMRATLAHRAVGA